MLGLVHWFYLWQLNVPTYPPPNHHSGRRLTSRNSGSNWKLIRMAKSVCRNTFAEPKEQNDGKLLSSFEPTDVWDDNNACRWKMRAGYRQARYRARMEHLRIPVNPRLEKLSRTGIKSETTATGSNPSQDWIHWNNTSFPIPCLEMKYP